MKTTATKTTPTLRFPGFSGVWEEKKLGDIGVFLKGKGISKEDIVTDGENKCIRYGELYTSYSEVIRIVKSKTNVSVEDLLVSKNKDIIIPSSGETALDIATVSCVIESGIILGGDLNVLRLNDGYDGIFNSYYLRNFQNKNIAKLSQGNSVVHLYSSHLKSLKINLPQINEQNKIAEFLSGVDAWIDNLKKQKENLESYKKGIMQKIFSQEMRFKDENGEGFGEWEKKRLGEVCKITTGKLDANAMKEDGQYRFYTCAKEFYKIDLFAFDTEALLVSGNGANVGYIHYYKGKFNAYQRTYVLDSFSQNIFFIKYFLDFNLSDRIESEKKAGNTPYIVMGTLTDMNVSLPEIKEQQKIAEFLGSVDNMLELKQKQVVAAEEWKRGVMQGVFV